MSKATSVTDNIGNLTERFYSWPQ